MIFSLFKPFASSSRGIKWDLAILNFSIFVYVFNSINSNLSSKGAGISLILFAVQINKTLDKSKVSSK